MSENMQGTNRKSKYSTVSGIHVFGGVIFSLFFCCFCSCSFFYPPTEINSNTKFQGPLQAAKPTEDAIPVDFFKVRVQFENRQLLQALWQDSGTNEQNIPIELRKRLQKEGIRIAIQGKSMSPTLSRLLELDRIRREESAGKLLERTTDAPPKTSDLQQGVDVNTLAVEPLVAQAKFTFLPGKTWEVKTYDDVIPEAAIFWFDHGPCGKTYPKAQGFLEMSAIPYPDGSGVRFDLLPILKYGDPRQSFRTINGQTVPEFGLAQRSFDELKTSIKLLPGQWLLIGPSSDSPPGIGRYLLTRDQGQTEQKLVAIRLAETLGERFRPNEELPLQIGDGE